VIIIARNSVCDLLEVMDTWGNRHVYVAAWLSTKVVCSFIAIVQFLWQLKGWEIKYAKIRKDFTKQVRLTSKYFPGTSLERLKKKLETFVEITSELRFKSYMCRIQNCNENTSILIGLQFVFLDLTARNYPTAETANRISTPIGSMLENKDKNLFSAKAKFCKHPSQNL